MRAIVVEVGEKYSNSIYLVKVMLIEYADKLSEGWERKRIGKDNSKLFMENQTEIVPFTKREDSGRDRLEGISRVQFRTSLRYSDGGIQSDIRVRRAGEEAELVIFI